jgi:hypothetical protein
LHESEGDQKELLSLLKELCPEGEFEMDPSGSGEVDAKEGFCKNDTNPEAGPGCLHAQTLLSCSCVCAAINSDTTFNISWKPKDPPHTDLNNEYDPNFPDSGSGNPNIFVGQPHPNGSPGCGDSFPPNGDESRVRDPNWLILGHELCGHALFGYGEGQGDATISIENTIRDEHSKCGCCGCLGHRSGSDHVK